jgi:hypothetical protein
MGSSMSALLLQVDSAGLETKLINLRVYSRMGLYGIRGVLVNASKCAFIEVPIFEHRMLRFRVFVGSLFFGDDALINEDSFK